MLIERAHIQLAAEAEAVAVPLLPQLLVVVVGEALLLPLPLPRIMVRSRPSHVCAQSEHTNAYTQH